MKGLIQLVLAFGLLTGVCLLTGCSDAKAPKGKDGASTAAKPVHDHSGWWCNEHGIPEEECSMCSAKVAKVAKEKGDWCDKHNRAKSQCFICDPKLKEHFAAKYRTKYGKEPPPIEE